MFEDYLTRHKLEYEKDYKVGSGDVDFLIRSGNLEVYCDVKALLETHDRLKSTVIAIKRLRKDIEKLRKKFKTTKPEYPCILVSMNFSPQSITGFTVVRAMYGEAGITVDKVTHQLTRALHHLMRGNAKMTVDHNTGISGILFFSFSSGIENYFFHNEYADNPLPQGFFPSTIDVITKKSSLREDLEMLGRILIQPYRG